MSSCYHLNGEKVGSVLEEIIYREYPLCPNSHILIVDSQNKRKTYSVFICYDTKYKKERWYLFMINLKLAELRKMHNLTQQELGEILNVSYQTISK